MKSWIVIAGVSIVAISIGVYMSIQPSLPGQTKVFSHATKDDLVALEELVGAPLPPHYRQFLETVNGGYFEACGIYSGDVPDSQVRPAPYDLFLQDLRTTNLPPDHPVSLFHDDWLDVIRVDEEVLLKIAHVEDASYIYVHLDAERADQIWIKTPDLPTWDGHDYPSEWFYLDENIDEFLKRLHHVPD